MEKIADLFIEISETENMKYLNFASEILIELSEREKTIMEKLKKASA